MNLSHYFFVLLSLIFKCRRDYFASFQKSLFLKMYKYVNYLFNFYLKWFSKYTFVTSCCNPTCEKSLTKLNKIRIKFAAFFSPKITSNLHFYIFNLAEININIFRSHQMRNGSLYLLRPKFDQKSDRWKI